MKEAVTASIAIWEHYLVYAVSLGIAQKVIKQLEAARLRYAAEEGSITTTFVPSFIVTSGSTTSSLSSLTSLTTSFAVTMGTVASAGSSSGSGGGFSGGGGGGDSAV